MSTSTAKTPKGSRKKGPKSPPAQAFWSYFFRIFFSGPAVTPPLSLSGPTTKKKNCGFLNVKIKKSLYKSSKNCFTKDKKKSWGMI